MNCDLLVLGRAGEVHDQVSGHPPDGEHDDDASCLGQRALVHSITHHLSASRGAEDLVIQT
jgi:hypothetical protein